MQKKPLIIRFTALAFAILAAISLSGPVRAAELVMFEQAGCSWCAQWHKVIGPIYTKTEAGMRAPLRRVDIHAPIPQNLEGVKIERFTPTFVLFDQGVEIGRIRGYPGEDFFWFLLDELVAQLPPST